MDWNQRNRLAVAPLQQSYGQLHQSVRSRAPLVLDVSHSHYIVAHQANHPTIVEMLTTVPMSSVSLTVLPSPNWTHPWRESLPSPWRRGVDLAGLLEIRESKKYFRPPYFLKAKSASILDLELFCSPLPYFLIQLVHRVSTKKIRSRKPNWLYILSQLFSHVFFLFLSYHEIMVILSLVNS